MLEGKYVRGAALLPNPEKELKPTGHHFAPFAK